MAKKLTYDDGCAAVVGGAVFGGGGGGSMEEGFRFLETMRASGYFPRLVGCDELAEQDLVACVAMVGAPSAQEASVSMDQTVEAVELLAGSLPGELKALVTNENGGSTTVNGWYQAAALGLPILDSPSNGRAHPTGTMGAFGLHDEQNYMSVQAFCGGSNERALRGTCSGNLRRASQLMRDASVLAGGLIFVCRNPIPVARARDYGAPGAVSAAIDLGRRMLSAEPGRARVDAVIDALDAQVLVEGIVQNVELEQSGGFDVGRMEIEDCEFTFWNEFMTADRRGTRVGTFPDLLFVLDADTGLPVSSAEVLNGQSLVALKADRSSIRLGRSMHDKKLLADIEQVIGKSVISELEESWF